ncbi:MAG: acylneuraminate cytidylyltransferase family protein [Bacilli bacterium]|nr:acylneuraminate cytidylyltransferase family protein [Bacilli bacterium]
MKNLAIIPARSGSKGLKNKNIMELNGMPLLAYSINAALKSGKFSHVMVSTDSKEYAEIAKKYGAEVPFLRDEISSSDSASSWDVVKEVLNKYEDLGITFDTVTLLQPTSPLRTEVDICNAHNLFSEKKATSVISVCETEHSPLWCNVLSDSLCMDGFLNNKNNSQRQKLDTYYRINGSIYIVDVKHFLSGKNIYDSGSYAYIMPINRSVDIDTKVDFIIAEALIKHLSE